MAHYKGAASEASRAMQMQKKREIEKQENEMKKKKIEDELKVSQIGNKFTAHYDAIEAQLKADTVGLVTLNQMKAKQEASVKERERQLAQKNEQKQLKQLEDKKRVKEQQNQQIKSLSFNFDEGDEEEEEEEEDVDDESDAGDGDDADHSKSKDQSHGESACDDSNSKDGPGDDSNSRESSEGPRKKLKITKNPDVDTSFLPDREREKEEMILREQLRQEWEQRQQQMKEEEVEVTFSYWDGSGHRRSVTMKKGNSIYQFLHKALEMLRAEFHELRSTTADSLMYVKEDLIIPHHYTFYDFIVTKARGKSGPLFSFDVHEDVRLVNDRSVEKDESHAGKVLLRSWYDRNKHIFPASRWEPYDPAKTYDKYTIKDTKKN